MLARLVGLLCASHWLTRVVLQMGRTKAEKKKKKLQQDYVPIKAANQQKQADALKVKGGCVVVIVVSDALCAVCCAALACCVSDVLRDVLCGVPPDWPLVRSAPLLVFVEC